MHHNKYNISVGYFCEQMEDGQTLYTNYSFMFLKKD